MLRRLTTVFCLIRLLFVFRVSIFSRVCFVCLFFRIVIYYRGLSGLFSTFWVSIDFTSIFISLFPSTSISTSPSTFTSS